TLGVARHDRHLRHALDERGRLPRRPRGRDEPAARTNHPRCPHRPAGRARRPAAGDAGICRADPGDLRRGGTGRRVMDRLLRFLMAKVLPPILVFVLAAAALEAYVRLRHVPMYYMPRPTDVLHTLLDPEERARARLLPSLLVTAEAALIGFAASTVVGILIAILLAASRWVRRAFYPYTLF